MADETQPLLGYTLDNPNKHQQYCGLVGIIPSNHPPKTKRPRANPNSLYERAKAKRSSTNLTYAVTATLSNTLLLSQVVLGAALTALGASASSHILITIFGAMNTIIAGVIAYLKSRGQPMRARMFRDDLERVVDEIENSEIMWMGISHECHGYDEIDIDDEVSVRSEVARLTKLYDRAVRNNTVNNPDMYMAGGGADAFTQLRARPGQPALPPVAPPPPAAAASAAPAPTAPPAAPEVEESPATAKPKSHDETAKDEDKNASKDEAKDNTDTTKEDPKDDPQAKKDEEASGGPKESNNAKAAAPEPTESSQPEPAPGVPLTNDVEEGPVTNVQKSKKQNGGS